MAYMRWKERMSVGVPELDADHSMLIDVINRLEANIDGPGGAEIVRQTLVALTRYAEFHFAREEKVLSTCRYGELDEHRVEHRSFVDRIRDVTTRFDTSSADTRVDRELLDFLKRWLTQHIMIVDMAYRPLVEGSAPARAAAKSFSALDIWWR